MKTMCPPGYHHNGFMTTHELGRMMYMSGGLFTVTIYLIKGSNKNKKTGCEICSKLTIKTVEQLQ